MRVVPLENEAVNECWIADRDRFSYEALNSDERLTKPMIKQGGEWKTVDWKTALDYVADGLKHIKAEPRRGQRSARWLGRTARSRNCTCWRKLVRGLGSENIDHRLRHADFANARRPAPRAGWARRSRRCRACSACSWSAPSCARTIRCSPSASARPRARAAQVFSLHAVARRLG